MITAYFIVQPKNMDRFDDIFDQEDVVVTKKDATQVRSLTAFIARDQGVVLQDYFILDVGDADSLWSVPHIIDAIRQLRKFANAKPILLGEPGEDLTELYGALANVQKETRLITDYGGSKVSDELRKYLKGEESSFGERTEQIAAAARQATLNIARPSMFIPPDFCLHVAVAGVMPRCGTTTQTFGIYHYLKSIGFHPVIFDEHGRLVSLMKQYAQGDLKGSDIYSFQGVDVSVRDSLPEYNAYIVDCGVLGDDNVHRFCGADLNVLVFCTKPWEYSFFSEAHFRLMGQPLRAFLTLANLSDEGDFQRLRSMTGGKYSAIAPYNPSLCRAPEDVTAYAATVLPAVRELLGEPSKAAPHPEPEAS